MKGILVYVSVGMIGYFSIKYGFQPASFDAIFFSGGLVVTLAALAIDIIEQ